MPPATAATGITTAGKCIGRKIPWYGIYRTREFIVKQVISLAHHGLESAKLISTDTYYLRTPGRDACYEGIFGENKEPDGKRIPTMAYFRSYRT